MSDLTYRIEGDYLVPNLAMDTQPEGRIGKYGMLRDSFLEQHRRAAYNIRMINGTMTQHLLDIDRRAQEMYFDLEEQYLQSNPLPDTSDTMELTYHRARIHQMIEEQILERLIYS